MRLTQEEQNILNGAEGKVREQAMRILVQYGEAVNADRLLDVDDVTFCIPCPYPTDTNADIEFDSMEALFSWADLCSDDEVFTDIPKVRSRRCTSLAGVPVLEMDVPHVTMDEHKSLGAAMCSSGQVDMYHIVRLTPEAQTKELAFGGNEPVETFHYGEKEEMETLQMLDSAEQKEVDIVLMGCPHFSIFQLRDIAEKLEGKKCKKHLVIMTARQILGQARENGYAQIIEEAGACLLTDACPPMINMWPEGTKVIATDSAKMAFYCAGGEFDIHMGSMEHCIDAALTGEWW